jgi:hypothetical protein
MSTLGQKRTSVASFNHLVGAQQECLGEVQAKSLSGGQIDNEIELGRLLDRQISGLCPAQNFVTALCAGILCTTPYSLSVTSQGSVSLSLDSAAARIGSVAGVHRRAMRRTYGVGANLGYHPVARAALYGAAAAGAGYYGAGYGGWGGYGYHPVARAALYGAAATGAGYYGAGYGGWGGYGYRTDYNPPGPFSDWRPGYYSYGYGTGYAGYHPVVRRGLYATAWHRWR